MNSELFNEILLYAHLDSSGIDSDDLNTNPNTLENEINSVEKTLNIDGHKVQVRYKKFPDGTIKVSNN